jgi:hypothetical protein
VTWCVIEEPNEGVISVAHMHARRRDLHRLLPAIFTALMVIAGSFLLSSGPAAASTPTLTIFAGTPGTTGTPTDGLPADQTTLHAPGSIALAGNGAVYIGDLDDAIYRVNAGTLTTLDSSICEPYGLAVAASGNIFAASDCVAGLTEVTPSDVVSIVPGTSSISDPTGVAIDPSGNIYVASGFSTPHDVWKIAPDGTVSIFATTVDVGDPFALATDTSGNVYVADTLHNVVHKITPSGAVSTLTTPALNDPEGLAVNSVGDVFISNNGDFTVLEVTPSGTSSVVAGTGVQGQPVAGAPTSVNLAGPTGLALDAAGDLLIADTDFGNQGVVEEIDNISPPSPPVPGSPTAADGIIVLPWSSVAGATSYAVTVYVNGVPQPAVTGITGLSYTVPAPVAGDTYSFTVAAVNGVGTGPASAMSAVITQPVPTDMSPGYWLVGADGGVFSFHAPFYGSTGSLTLNQPMRAITSTRDGRGYWLIAGDGGVFAFGDAGFQGSVPGLGLGLTDIVGIAPDNATGGYWLVGSDGGVYSFGAPFHGSVPGLGTHVRNVVGIAATPDGGGYYVVASDGGVYTFGDAAYRGSANTVAHLNAPIVGMAVDPVTGGYWEAGSDGGVYSFGAPFAGSAGATPLNRPVVGMSASPSGPGYYLAASDGGVFSYGESFSGSEGGAHLNAPMVGMATDRVVPPS